MKHISDNPLEIESYIHDFFIKNEYENISVNENSIKIMDKDGNLFTTVSFEKDEYEEELKGLKSYSENCVVYSDSIVFALLDKNKAIVSPIELIGSYKGEIKPTVDSKALIISNMNDLCNIELLDDADKLESLISDKIVQIEIRNITITNDYELLKVISSVVCSVSFHTNILLDIVNEKPIKYSQYRQLNKITLYKSEDYEPILYFNSAEKTSYPHIKYIEYYHVIEFFFLSGKLRKISEIIQETINIKLFNNDDPLKNEYLNAIAKINKIYDNSEFDGEQNQIKYVIRELLSFALLKSIFKNTFDSNISFLKDKTFGIEQAGLDLSKIYNKRIKLKINQEDKNCFCNALAIRIYKIRNFLVHTKKGEGDNIFVPTDVNFKSLSDDIKLLRSIAYSLLSKPT